MKDTDDLIFRAGLILRRMEQLAQHNNTDQPTDRIQAEWHKLEDKWQILMAQMNDRPEAVSALEVPPDSSAYAIPDRSRVPDTVVAVRRSRAHAFGHQLLEAILGVAARERMPTIQRPTASG